MSTLHSASSRPVVLFLMVQLLIVSVVSAALWRTTSPDDVRRREPTLVNEPLLVAPQYNVSEIVSDEQLAMVLSKLRPRFRHASPKINHVDHALRCWGAEVEFADPQFLSGTEMRRLLTDHEAFRQAWGPKTRPLLLDKQQGVAYRTQQGDSTASHVDHTLGTLAECGTPLDFPIRLAGRSATLRDVLGRAVASFDINQAEYEWTVLALAMYVSDGRPWYSPDGERLDFDRLVRRVMRQRYGQGVCYGQHRLYTLTVLLRIDDSKPLLSAPVRGEIVQHLEAATRHLVANQHADGYWDGNWHNLKLDVKGDELGGPLSRRLLATGHALEWWAMAPKELQPPREVQIRAAQWLVQQVRDLDDRGIDNNYTFLSHVGRALALWRGGFPAEMSLRLEGLTAVRN